jgi:hypothetical protein
MEFIMPARKLFGLDNQDARVHGPERWAKFAQAEAHREAAQARQALAEAVQEKDWAEQRKAILKYAKAISAQSEHEQNAQEYEQYEYEPENPPLDSRLAIAEAEERRTSFDPDVMEVSAGEFARAVDSRDGEPLTKVQQAAKREMELHPSRRRAGESLDAYVVRIFQQAKAKARSKK